MYENLALLAIFVLLYSSVAGAIERTWVSGPIVFTAFGLLVGPMGLGLLTWETDRETIRTLAEVTLALVLFTGAAGADMDVLKKTTTLPARLLLIGLPLTILLGFGAGVLLLGHLPLFAIALLATMLAPTDAALGKAVITNEVVPEEVRQGLNVESGLNDGICVPILLVFLALALDQAGNAAPWELAVRLVAKQLGIGLVVGLLLTLAAAQILKTAWRRHWLTGTWIQIPVVALALACFATAQYLGGSGFVAAFSGGLLFGAIAKDARDGFVRAAEGIGDTLELLTWVVFGSAVVGQALGSFNWNILLYALCSLTVIRMLPVLAALTGSGIDTEGRLFIGWFGPRGLASIVFAVILVNSELPDSRPVIMTVACTIILSILAHGITANPWARAYGQRLRLKQQGTGVKGPGKGAGYN